MLITLYLCLRNLNARQLALNHFNVVLELTNEHVFLLFLGLEYFIEFLFAESVMVP